VAATSTTEAGPPEPGATRRRYESLLRAKRAEETRAALIGAATDLFTTNGWAGTPIRDVAKAAGVAVETLYKHFPSKRQLLDAVIDEAVVGDDAPVAVAERPEFLAMGTGDRAERIAAAASLVRAINGRTAPFTRLIREAATTDPEIAEVLRATRERQRTDIAAGLSLLLGRAPTDDERDGAWAILSPEVHQLLVHESGWSHDRYEKWARETLTAILPSN
jgi:AcrR family transcriptional regulator